jgi:type III pantothenate kinase
MLLCIDIGNTNITLGLYNQNDPGPRWRLSTDQQRMPDEFGIQLLGLISYHNIKPDQIKHAAIASVVPPLTIHWIEVCQSYLGCSPLVIDSDTTSGINIQVDKPSEVGADRIVDAVAAHSLFGGPACIIDFGTATTFDAISKEGDYLGGAISPGIGIARDALAEKTAKLPKVDLTPPPSPIGKNTIHAMQSGLIYGYVGLLEGMVARFSKELGADMKVIATGGLAEFISRHSAIIQIVAPWLTLDGIQIIFQKNLDQ